MAFFKFWKWLLPYLRDFVHQDAAYQTYPNGNTGIFNLTTTDERPVKVAVAADWGTGTLEAATVAKNIHDGLLSYTVHLGDVYYMGEVREVQENCLGEKTKDYTGVFWPKGQLGSFALMGNHEMYSGGQGYFQKFLHELGLYHPDSNLPSPTVKDPQSASYFCLELNHWIVFGLDTGYHSGGMPGFSVIPGINRIPSLNVDARFDDQMVNWLERTIQSLGSKLKEKSVVILTHHQPLSSFEHAFPKPAEQLERLGFLSALDFVWLYGHEHRLTIYEKQILAGALRVYPRCIGHGGMPVSVTEVNGPDSRILYYDPRQHPIDNEHPDTPVGYNGHVVLIFSGADLTIEYRDITNNNLLLAETFTPRGAAPLGHSVSLPPESPLKPGH